MLNKKTKGKKGLVGIKLDMAKAYDRIEMDFLSNTLLTTGFPNNLVMTIMKCVSSVSFSVLINGQPTTTFTPQRGLRQGDPLSPYLFILCAEVLSGLLLKSQEGGLFHGLKIANNAPPISHLFFADDSVVFCRANTEEAQELTKIFKLYQNASGQKINMDKSEMCFSKNTRLQDRLRFRQWMPIKITERITKYLGIPAYVGRSKQQIFNHLIDKIRAKLKGWKERHLSFAGRAILIKAVAQAMSTYIMSCFMLPQGICDQIESLISQFWWG
ncbi:hypothetical protein A2U01_0002030, partial [Trifolium medium]|nr:hypothetical protein [Trifolium medium]